MNFRTASRSELDLAVEWAAREGWNPGLDDADVFWNTDPEGFVCAEREGEVVATGSVVSYGHFGFMGFFIVRPDLRGHGLGRDFWHWRRDRLLQRLESPCVIGMDGVFDMQAFYAKGGFVFSHRNLRMEGVGEELPVEGPVDASIVPLTEVDFSTLASYDARHFGRRRDGFLRRWITLPHGRSMGILKNGKLAGMGVIRQCRNGHKIGPLFADDASLAEALYAALVTQVPGEAVFLDVPEPNLEALALASRHGMREVFGCARMYHGPKPDLPLSTTFGITTFELG